MKGKGYKDQPDNRVLYKQSLLDQSVRLQFLLFEICKERKNGIGKRVQLIE